MTEFTTIAGPVVAVARHRNPRRWYQGWSEVAAVLALAGLALVIEPHLWPPISVAVVTVDNGPVRLVVRSAFPGSLNAQRGIRVGPRVSGRVARVLVHAGDRVREGAVLLTLDAGAAYTELAARKQVLAAATTFARDECAAAASAADRVGLTRWLAEVGRTAVRDIAVAQDLQDVANGGCDAALAWITWARAAVVQAEEDIAATVLRAPFAAVVVSVDAAEGDVLARRHAAVIDLMDATTLYVKAGFEERDARLIQIGSPVQLTSRSQPGVVAGRVRHVARADEGNAALVQIDLVDADVPAWLIAGGADASVMQVREAATRIPAGALIEGRTVFVVRGGRMARVAVAAGLAGDEFIEVTAGLRPGDAVVVSPRWPLLASGMRVRATVMDPR